MDKNYPLAATCLNENDLENYGKKREEIIELNFQKTNLDGELDLTGFVNLQKLIVPGFYLERIKNFTERTVIFIDMPEGSYEKPGFCLTGYIPPSLRKHHTWQIKKGTIILADESVIDFCSYSLLRKLKLILGKRLTGLRITNCQNLKKIDYSYDVLNYLTKLKIVNCPNLEVVDCSNNQLIDFEVASCPKLVELNLMDNNLSARNLTFLTSNVNLEALLLGNEDKENLKEGKYNKYYGSLKPLKNMDNLKFLHIVNTNIDSGLEYLPVSLEIIDCNGCSKLTKTLKNYSNDDLSCNYQTWRNDHLDLIKQIRENEKLVVIIRAINSSLARHNQSSELSKIEKVISILKFYCEEKVISARKLLYQEEERTAQIEIPFKK